MSRKRRTVVAIPVAAAIGGAEPHAAILSRVTVGAIAEPVDALAVRGAVSRAHHLRAVWAEVKSNVVLASLARARSLMGEREGPSRVIV